MTASRHLQQRQIVTIETGTRRLPPDAILRVLDCCFLPRRHRHLSSRWLRCTLEVRAVQIKFNDRDGIQWI